MLTKKSLVTALIAAGALGAVAAPLPSSAAGFEFSFSTGHARSDNFYGHGYRQQYQPTRWDRNNFHMRDRDGDGVPNRFDNYPNNPRWR